LHAVSVLDYSQRICEPSPIISASRGGKKNVLFGQTAATTPMHADAETLQATMDGAMVERFANALAGDTATRAKRLAEVVADPTRKARQCV